MLLNKSLNLAVMLYDDVEELEEKSYEARNCASAVRAGTLYFFLPGEEEQKVYLFLEDVISNLVHKMFTGYGVLSVTRFRITRNADLTIHEEGARDLLKVIEKGIEKKRKRGAAVRLEIGKTRIGRAGAGFFCLQP
ncbi:hypothetical protein GCM10020331_088330 [Ectobacillus funiculus]